MDIENLLNHLLKVIYSNPEKVKIEYNINEDGNESLKVNGEELLPKFNDSRIKEIINTYKANIDALDDCVFVEALEALEDEIDFKEMDKLLNQESFTQADANLAEDLINIVSESIRKHIKSKIEDLEEIYNKFC